MKSPDEAAFKTILIISMILSILLLPFVARAESEPRHQPPAFSEFDADGVTVRLAHIRHNYALQ